MLIQIIKWLYEIFTSTLQYVWPVYILLIIIGIPMGIVLALKKRKKNRSSK